MRIRIWAVALTSLLVVAGCSGTPGEHAIESQVTADLAKGGGDELLKVENFKKVNGFLKDDRTYIADIHYDIVLKQSIKSFVENAEATVKSSKDPAGAEQVGGALLVMGLALQFGDGKAGDRYPKDDKVTLLKTDNGWQLSD